jgi:hypothetical protein
MSDLLQTQTVSNLEPEADRKNKNYILVLSLPCTKYGD